jgi:hypothetical protein
MPVTATAVSSVRAMSSSTGTTPGSTLAGGPSQTGCRYSTSARASDGGGGGGSKKLIEAW